MADNQENKTNQLYYMQISVDHMEMMKYLTDEQRGIALRLIFDYFRGEKSEQEVASLVQDTHPIILPVFAQLKISIDRGRSAYEERCRRNRENGKKGGAPKGNRNARKKGADAPWEDADDECGAQTADAQTEAVAEQPSYQDVRRFQVENRVGGGEDASDFFNAFERSGTLFPENWQDIYTKFACGAYSEQNRFLQKLENGGYREQWGSVFKQNNRTVEKTTETSQ